MYEVDSLAEDRQIIVDDVETESLFNESLLALSPILSEGVGGTPVTREVDVAGEDLEQLLRRWLQALVRLAARDGFLPERLEKERLEGHSFKARVAGVRELEAGAIRDVEVGEVELRRLDDGAWAVRASLCEQPA